MLTNADTVAVAHMFPSHSAPFSGIPVVSLVLLLWTGIFFRLIFVIAYDDLNTVTGWSRSHAHIGSTGHLVSFTYDPVTNSPAAFVLIHNASVHTIHLIIVLGLNHNGVFLFIFFPAEEKESQMLVEKKDSGISSSFLLADLDALLFLPVGCVSCHSPAVSRSDPTCYQNRSQTWIQAFFILPLHELSWSNVLLKRSHFVRLHSVCVLM